MGMLSPMQTTACPDVTYTALAGGQLNCATLEVRKAKSSFLFTESRRKSIQLPGSFVFPDTFLRTPLPLFSPCRFLQTVRGVYVPYNIQPRGTLQLLLQVRNEYLVCILIESTNACGKTVYDNGTIHDFAVVRQRRLWFLRLHKTP